MDPVRVCEECAMVAKKENEFFDKYLKTLTQGMYPMKYQVCITQ